MNEQHVRSAVEVLDQLFATQEDDYMGMKTLELYIELGLLKHAPLLASVIEEKGCGDLVDKFTLFDVPATEQIKLYLNRNSHYTDVEFIATRQELEA